MLKRKILKFSLVLILFAAATGNSFAQPDSSVNSFQPNPFSKKSFEKHLLFLGSDLFEGRGTGTLGGYLAAKYIAYKFNEYNLKPVGDDRSYYQNIPMHGSTPLPESELTIYTSQGEINLELGIDYLMYKCGEQTYIPKATKLVFAGYGIIAPEFDYNDYAATDVEGKIVVLLDGEPVSDEVNYFDAEIPTVYSTPEVKQRIAISRGAAGCIIIADPFLNGDNWKEKMRQYSFEDVRLSYSVPGNFCIILNSRNAEALFVDSPLSYQDVFRMHEFGSVKSFPLLTGLKFHGVFKEREFFSPNITGLVEGEDKESFLIVSAHYDHLGIGPSVDADSIYNGLLDNAMGVAALLQIAERFATSNEKPGRSILFIATTGEEKGLLGSTHYTDNPIVPLHKTIANINIDGIATFDRFKSIVGIGAEYSTLNKFLQTTAQRFGLKVTDIPPEFKHWEAFNRSDQMAFALAGIPSLMTVDGLDYVNLSREEGLQKIIKYDKSIYHTPFDDFSLEINYSASVQHVNYIYNLIFNIVNNEIEPEWNPGSPFINARLRSIAERR